MLTHSLGMSEHQELLLITSPGYGVEIELITETANQQEISVTPIVIPHSEQYRFTSVASLPGLITTAINACDGMIVLLEYSVRSTPFRMALLNAFVDRQPRVCAASMPGVRLPEFRYASADFRELDDIAEVIGTALLRTQRIEIETQDSAGVPHRLRFATDRRPTICGSRINEGDWDNIPSGETFILPRHGTGNGSVVVNGSIPGWPMGRGEHLVLNIVNGKVVEVHGSPPELENAGRSLLFKDYEARRQVSKNAVKFCELGFGVNRSVQTFHGIPIFDEKIYGTIHLAFGRNDQLGGDIKGASHHDLVVKNAVVRSDGFDLPLVAGGDIIVGRTDVEPDWSTLTPLTDRRSRVHLTGEVLSVRPETGELFLEWHQSAGGRVNTRIGNHETSRLCARLYHLLGAGDQDLGSLMDMMDARWNVPADATGAAVTLLKLFGVVSVARGRRRDES